MIRPETIAAAVEAGREEFIALRRWFHRRPEPSLQEVETRRRILEILDDWGLPVLEEQSGGGVVALLRGGDGTRTLALRADMDALPIQERRPAPYRSERPGLMHACGHDFHMAAVLAAARVLSGLGPALAGNVKFLFQPGEERISGAARMIAAGALRDPDVTAVVGLHAYPLLPTGVVGVKYGVMMASSDRFVIHVHGKTGHAAKPHLSVDAIAIAAMLLQAIHQIVSSRIDPVHPAVVSVGMIRGGAAENIVCDHVEMRGTIRATSAAVRDQIIRKIEQKARGITEAMDGDYAFELEEGSPPLDNDEAMTRLVEQSAAEILGPGRVVRLDEPSMGGEDFSRYIAEVPGTYFRIGTGNPDKDTCHYLHSDLFDVDEEALPEAVKVLCWTALRYLGTTGGEGE